MKIAGLFQAFQAFLALKGEDEEKIRDGSEFEFDRISYKLIIVSIFYAKLVQFDENMQLRLFWAP